MRKIEIAGYVCVCMLCGCTLEDPHECINGNQQCIDKDGVGYLQTCVDEHWDDGTRCTNKYDGDLNAHCHSKTECGDCDADICFQDANGLSYEYTCNIETHLFEKQGKPCVRCADNQSCSEDKCSSKDDRCFVDESTGQVNHYYCQNGLLIENSSCPVCISETQCGECKPGVGKCRNIPRAGGEKLGLYQTCTNGIYDYEQLCIGACIDETSCKLENCQNGDVICQNDTEQTGYLKSCINGAYPETNSCLDNSSDDCSKCPDGNSCTKDMDECGECINGTPRCENGYIYKCENGKYNMDTKTVCDKSLGICAVGDECVECLMDTISCQNNISGEGTLDIQCSENSEGQKQPSCHGASCNADGTNCGECNIKHPPKCTNDEEGIGTVEICNNGEWEENVVCDDKSCFYQGQSCGECLNGDSKCEEGRLMICREGKWGYLGYSSGVTYSCPSGSCDVNGKLCENDKDSYCIDYGIYGVMITKNGNKITIEQCKDGVSCNEEGTACGECNSSGYGGPNSHCTDDENGIGYVVECKNGKKLEYSCEDRPCDYRGNYECAECKPGDTKCENGTITICDGGVWGYNGDPNLPQPWRCPSGSACDEAGKMCNINTSYCIESSGGNGYPPGTGFVITHLDSGTTIEICNGNFSCNEKGTACGECNSSGYAGPLLNCQNDSNGIGYVKGCKNGKLSDYSCEISSCKANIGSMSTECGVCIAGETKCVNGTMTLCDGGVWGYNGDPYLIGSWKCPDNSACDQAGKKCNVNTTYCVNSVSAGNAYPPEQGFVITQKGPEVTVKRCENAHSCNEEGTDCGECWNGQPTTCKNNSQNVGEFTQCVAGSLQKSVCPDNAACKDNYRCP